LVSEPGFPIANSRNDRLETLQKMLDDFIKLSSERLKRVDDRLRQQGAIGSGENSITKNHDKGSGCSKNNQGTKVTKLDFPKYNGQEDPTS